jgi:hypothetical protein
MFDAHQALAASLWRSQSEVPSRISFGMCHFVHAAGKRQQNNVVARRRLVAGSVGHNTSNLGGKQGCWKKDAGKR